MDVAQQFINEEFAALFQRKIDFNGQEYDFLQFIFRMAQQQEEILRVAKDTNKTTNVINSKMDIVLERLNSIEKEILGIKNEKRDVEQKLILISSKLSKFENDSIDYDEFYDLAQRIYSNWDSFDPLTQKMLPTAEYLYSQLQNYDKPDFSPVIIELCRAIENEFLLKVFRKYTLDLIDRKADSLDEFLAVDKATEELVGKTGVFVRIIVKSSKTREPIFTLGEMNIILSYARSEKTVRISPLLADFVDYLKENTEAGNLLDKEYIKKIDDIVNNYRNPSAHPGYMSIENANKCREKIPDRLDYFIDCMLVNS